MLMSVGTSATPRCGHQRRSGPAVRPVPCSMQSMPAVDQVGQRVLAEAVRRHPGAVLVRLGDRRLERVTRPAAARGRPTSRSIQSPTSLTQPSPRRASCATYAASSSGLDLVGVVADVALRPGDVTAGPDDLRQVLAVVDPAGVGGRPRVADEQRAGVPVGQRLLLGHLVRHRAVLVEPDVAVRVDETRDDPGVTRGCR